MTPKQLEEKLSRMERMIKEMHAEIMCGGKADLQSGSYAIKLAAREFLKGNNKPLRALGGRKLAVVKSQGGAP